MANKGDATRVHIDNIKAQLRSTTTCSGGTVDALQELFSRRNEDAAQKENVKVRSQATARRRAGTATPSTASGSVTKQTCTGLTPREKYILATEVANTTLKTLSEALKNTPTLIVGRSTPKTKPSQNEEARKRSRPRPGHTKTSSTSQRPLMERSASQTHNSPQKRLPRRSSSYSSFTTAGPEAGLVAMAECARLAFGYLGTSEAARVLGRDVQDLQYENGVSVLIGKLVALGLDTLAVKELRALKKRLDIILSKENQTHEAVTGTAQQKPVAIPAAERDNLANLLNFGTMSLQSATVPIVITFQTYVLRIIAKLRRPQIIEGVWHCLKLSNPSSVVNLVWHTAKLPNAQAKAARQLESLAQTILSLCPNISPSDDDRALEPAPDTVLALQQLAFKIRRMWWGLVGHHGDEEQELLNPFGKCIVAFARRSQLPASKVYQLAETLFIDLSSQQIENQSPASVCPTPASNVSKILSSLAQAAGLADDALRWAGAKDSVDLPNLSAAKNALRSLRVSTVSLDAFIKGDGKFDLQKPLNEAIEALNGGLGGTTAELESLFLEANALRRTATRLLIADPATRMEKGHEISRENLVSSVIAACVHFSARFIGSRPLPDSDKKLQARYNERIGSMWKSLKSTVDSVLTCCRQEISSEHDWKILDKLLQECSHIVYRLEEDIEEGHESDDEHRALVSSSLIKLSNAYWSVFLHLRKSGVSRTALVLAMERSIQLVQSRSAVEVEAGHLTMKLEQLGETLEGLDQGGPSRKAFAQCIHSHLDLTTREIMDNSAAKYSLYKVFSPEGPLNILARVLKAFHRSFLRFGMNHAEELAYYDDTELSPAVRGAVLEWQLGFFLRTLAKNRHWNSDLDKSITCLVEQLSALYTHQRFPIRRIRFFNMLLKLSQIHPHVLSKELRSLCLEDDREIAILACEDQGLQEYVGHLQTLQRFKTLMQQRSLSTEDLRQCLAIWESLLNRAASWENITEKIDNVEEWLQEIQSCIDLLNAKGEEYLAIGALHLQILILEMQREPDPNDMINALCAQGLQFLRLGYTGRSGLSLAKAEALTKKRTASTEAVLQWNISYAEYLLTIGNSKKCATVMANAQSIALADRSFMDLAKSSTTLSGRVRFNRVLADATYVLSLLAAGTGSFKDAARHAKQCVSLNRRIWAALESRVDSKKPVSDAENAAGATHFNPLSSLRSESGVPVVMSVTHDALSGPDFWSLVPALYRGMMQHSQLFINQGLFHEAIYIAEQADKVACATGSLTFQVDNASWRADCWTQSGRQDKAEELLASVKEHAGRKCLSSVGYYSAIARTHHRSGQYREELEAYTAMEQVLEYLASPEYIESLVSFLPAVDEITEKIEALSIKSAETQKESATTRGRKTAAKSVPRATTKSSSRAQIKPAPTTAASVRGRSRLVRQCPSPDSPEPHCKEVQSCNLSIFRANILDRKVLANISLDDLTSALDLLNRAEELQDSYSRELSHIWATFKTRLAQSLKQIAEDFTVNTLPESTIAFPAIGLKESVGPEVVAEANTVPKSVATTKNSKTKGQAKQKFVATLCDARERLVEAHNLCAATGSSHLFQQVSMALSEITVLLSAVSGTELRGSLHPLYAAFMSEIPKCNSLRLLQDSVEAEKQPLSRDECLVWPTNIGPTPFSTSIVDFQQNYVDIIPDSWSVVSMALNEGKDELYVTRFESGHSPFVLRLPLARQASREMDEEEFSFQDGKRDFDEIIELSDFSTRTAKDMTSRDARQQWWTEREALDTRLNELLVNIENIWLGGFRGIFSPHQRKPALLARFRKSLENILDKHLPSRKKKSQTKRPVLDTRVLDLFVGLGDASDNALDLDEALMDLIYFVVDILHFNGERNAYDEVDFDSMVIEVHDALSAYHSAARSDQKDDPRHTILILDKHLHCFPWESLPCLEQLSISRLPSLAALRERLIAARPSQVQDNLAPGHHISTSNGGTSILNPSGDLAHTAKVLKPHLDDLQGPWTHITNRGPSEQEFEASLREKDLVLYFGHGSGAQYIKSKTVRRLYPGSQQDDDIDSLKEKKVQPGCATTLLFGCSSVHLTDNGIYEPSGMLASYLTAGAPAILGMLWDVTDKDCDRFAVRAGELWGLWSHSSQSGDDATNDIISDASNTLPPKTPAKKTKGKGRVAQLVSDEVESVRRSPGSKSRKGRNTVDNKAKKKKEGDENDCDGAAGRAVTRGCSLDEAVREARKACVLKYLNGAAAVVYGIPVYLE